MLKKLLVVAGLAIFAVSTATASASGGLPPSGKIWFGKNYSRSKSGDLVVVGKKSTFSTSGRIAWVAHFDQQAGTTKIKIFLYSDKNGKTSKKWSSPITLKHANSNEFANNIPAHDLYVLASSKYGSYKLAYLRGSHVLATGLFNLTK